MAAQAERPSTTVLHPNGGLLARDALDQPLHSHIVPHFGAQGETEGAQPLRRESQPEPSGKAMWRVSPPGQGGAMIFLTHSIVLIVALIFITMTLTPLVAEA